MPEPYQLAQSMPTSADAMDILVKSGEAVNTLALINPYLAALAMILTSGVIMYIAHTWMGRRRKNGGSTSSLIDALNNVAESQTATAESLAAMAAQIEGLREDLAEDRQRQTGRDERIAKALTVLLTHKTESRIAA